MKRVLIPEPFNPGERPLTIPNNRDRFLLECFLRYLKRNTGALWCDSNHGFIKGRGTLSLLRRGTLSLLRNLREWRACYIISADHTAYTGLKA